MTVAAPCKHHDVIETPNGLISKAVCQFCGRERTYANYRFNDYHIPSKERDD